MATKTENILEIRPLKIVETEIRIVGDSPLIVHAWGPKALRQMLQSQMLLSKGRKKEPKRPADDFIQSMYWLSGKPEYSDDAPDEECLAAYHEAIAKGAAFGFPATAFKQAAQSAAYRLGWTKDKMGLRGAFFIKGDENDMVQIFSDDPVMREDPVRVGMGTADLRYRAQFNNWSATLPISYNAAGEYSLEAIVNAINAGGYVVGVGEWRPEKDGNYGRFHVATV